MKKQFHKVVSKFTIVFLIIGMLVGGCKEKETSKVAVRLPSFPAIKSSIQKLLVLGIASHMAPLYKIGKAKVIHHSYQNDSGTPSKSKILVLMVQLYRKQQSYRIGIVRK